MSGLPKSFQYDPEREVMTIDQVCILAEYFECTLELGEKKTKTTKKCSYQAHGPPAPTVPRNSAIKQAILAF